MSITVEKIARPDDAIKNLIEWQEQLDFDGSKVGVSRQALEETLEYLQSVEALLQQGEPEGWRKAVSELVIAARTSGGVAGRDEHLCAALDKVEAMLSASPLPAPGSETNELNRNREDVEGK